MKWKGEADRRFIAYLGANESAVTFTSDPLEWALETLGFDTEIDITPERDAVQQRFRSLLRNAHPDHGGQIDLAADRIAELTEARRILLA